MPTDPLCGRDASRDRTNNGRPRAIAKQTPLCTGREFPWLLRVMQGVLNPICCILPRCRRQMMDEALLARPLLAHNPCPCARLRRSIGPCARAKTDPLQRKENPQTVPMTCEATRRTGGLRPKPALVRCWGLAAASRMRSGVRRAGTDATVGIWRWARRAAG